MTPIEIFLFILILVLIIWNVCLTLSVINNRKIIDAVGEYLAERRIFYYCPENNFSKVRSRLGNRLKHIDSNGIAIRKVNKDLQLLAEELGYKITTLKQKEKRIICDTKNSSNENNKQKCSCSK